MKPFLLGPGDVGVAVTGVGFYQGAIGSRLGPVELVLEREPSNAADANAVKVVLGGALVGYLPAEDAELYAPLIDRLNRARAAAHVEGDVREGDAFPRFILLRMPTVDAAEGQVSWWESKQ